MSRRHTILVVDDEPDVVDSVSNLLRFDYRVLGATRALDGLRLMREQKIHIVMTDQQMPGMTGVELVCRVRDEYPDAIRLVMTGHADVRAVIAAINEGHVFRYITKPWNSDELQAILRQAAEYYELRAERERLWTELQIRNHELERANTELLKYIRKDKQLGQYQLLEKLGQGGMGTVHKALHVLLMRVVAVKVLAANCMGNPEAVTRFCREMKAVGRLNHPHIVQAIDAGEVDGVPFLVMEFVEGIAVSKLIAQSGPLPFPDACELARQAALGLQHAHEHGLVHRDLKPSNLILARTGVVKVLDLGLARLCDEPSVGEQLTALGQVLGTADYMAPEQAFDTRSVDIRADLYSLGCTLYHLLTGRAPFSGPAYERTMDKLLAHAQKPVQPIREFRPELPAELAALLDRLLAKNPTERFGTPAEVAAALQPFTGGADLLKFVHLPESQQAGLPETESYGPRGV